MNFFPSLRGQAEKTKRQIFFLSLSLTDLFFFSSGGVEACVEDVVNFVNKRRRGADGAVGTKVDHLKNLSYHDMYIPGYVYLYIDVCICIEIHMQDAWCDSIPLYMDVSV